MSNNEFHVYETSELIDRMYDELNNQINITESSKLILSRPEVSRENKKTAVNNFSNICLKLNRNHLEVQKFFEDELLKKTSIDSKGSLIVCGMFRPIQIESILMNYIKEFVVCKECKCTDTKLYKECRVVYLECNKCKSKKAQ
jgi:translation initiation factor 2 subunit 2